MSSLNSRRNRPGLAASMAIAWVGLAGWLANASAQTSFDPYRPEMSRYDAFSFPTVPNNLALPNAARDASQYYAPQGPGSSRFNTFERYLSEGVDNDGQSLGRSRGPNVGVPYYEAYRRYDREFQRDYIPNRDTDRTYYADQERKDRLYQAALKERDPTRRAQLLREYHQATRTRQPLPPARSTAASRPGAKPATRDDRAEALAAEALDGSRSSVMPGTGTGHLTDPLRQPAPERPDLSGGTRAILNRQRREADLLRRRPPLPIEAAPDRRSTAVPRANLPAAANPSPVGRPALPEGAAPR